MQEHHIGRSRRQLQAVEVQAVVADAFWQVIGQGHGKQLAYPLHRVLAGGNRQRSVVEAAGPAFARRVAVQAGYGCLHVTGQPGRLDQALGVDHKVVLALAHALLERLPLATLDGLPEVLAPATDRHRDDLVDRGVPTGDFGEAFFHHPIETDAGNGMGGIGKRRQGVDYIPSDEVLMISTRT